MTTPAGQEPQPPSVNDLLRGAPPTREEARQEAYVTVAREARARNPETVARLLDAQQSEDPEGAVRALRRSDPYLFRRSDAGAGEGQGAAAPPEPSFTDVIRHHWRGRA